MTRPEDRSPFGLSVMRQPGDDPTRRLRPVPMSSIFEIAARILRRHWLVLLALSVLVGLPGALLGAAAGVPLGDALVDILPAPGSSGPIVVTDAQAESLGRGLLIATVGSLLATVLGAIIAVGFAWVVSCDYHGRAVTLGGAVRHTLGRALPALGAAVLASVATLALVMAGVAGVALTLALLAPGGAAGGGVGVFLAILVGVGTFFAILVVSVRWALALPVVAVEPVGPLGALRRSWHLTGEAMWRTFAALLLVGLMVVILGALVSQLLAILVVDLVARPAGQAGLGEVLVNTLVTTLFAPVSTVVMTVYLYDQRVRRDGWDLPPPEAAPSPWGSGTQGPPV